MDEYCAVINCKRKLQKGEYIEIDGVKYCKMCATLIAKETILELMRAGRTIRMETGWERKEKRKI